LNTLLNRSPKRLLVHAPAKALAVRNDDYNPRRFVLWRFQIRGLAHAGDEVGSAESWFEFVDLSAELADCAAIDRKRFGREPFWRFTREKNPDRIACL